MSRSPIVLLTLLLLTVPMAGCFGTPEDDDNMDKAAEEAGWDIRVTRLDGSVEERHVSSSPYEADADQDGLEDFNEMLERLDPDDPDTDGDGLADGEDVFHEDEEVITDWKDLGIAHEDQEHGTLFFGERGNGTLGRGGDPRLQDTDADGIMDGAEAGGFGITVQNETRTVTTSVHAFDSDGDRLSDGYERDNGFDPSLRDMDNDGVPDGVDVDPWSDLTVRFVVEDVAVTSGTHDIAFRLTRLGDDGGRTSVVTVRSGQETDASLFDIDGLDAPDHGGDVLNGRHDVGFSLLAVRIQDGQERSFDMVSDVSGNPVVGMTFHALDETLVADADPEADPVTAFTASGPDGSLTFRLEKV